MPVFTIKVFLDDAPTTKAEARAIERILTSEFGSEGFEPVTAWLQGNKLVVVLKKKEEDAG